MKNILLIFLFSLLFLGCTPEENKVESPKTTIPQLVSMSGQTIRLMATDAPVLVESNIITTDDNKNIPDGTQFRLTADTVNISENNSLWVSSMLVSSIDGKFKFYVKPHTVVGLYRVNAYPVENSNIKFDQGLNARYFINIVPGVPTSIGSIKTDVFEDQLPYNGIKDSGESWIVTANPDFISYISVGPIVDVFGNLIEEGNIDFTPTQGSITSENPTRIIAGYSYFAYKSNGTNGSFNATATIVDHPLLVSLNQSEMIKKSSPQLALLDTPDFSAMTVGSTKCETLRLINNGTMASSFLDLSASFPFILVDELVDDVLCPKTADTCAQRQSLRSGESCKLRVKFTMPATSVSDGELIAQVSPQEFAGSLLIQKLRTQSVQSAQLISSNPFVSFGGTQCSSSKTVDITIENIGDFDATGIVVQNPPPNSGQSNPFYSIILPPQDAPMSSDMNAVVNCGTTFPAGRKCRVQVRFSPNAGILNQALIGKILGSNINPLVLSVSGYTVPGQALNNFPISFITPNNSLLPLGMFIHNSQQTRVDVGPIVDACNQRVADGSILTSIVSGGSLVQSTLVSNNGFASFYWNSINDPLKIGNQTIDISVGSGGSKSGTLLFRGVDLVLSGASNFGQVIDGRPKDLIVNLSNNGNVDATNLSISIESPLIIVDKGTCVSERLNAGQSCQITVRANPIGINQDLNLPLIVSSAVLGNNSISLMMSLNARTKPILSFDKNQYLFNDGSLNSSYTQTITLTNGGPAISYDTTINVESPFVLDSTTCPTTLNVNQSCQIQVSLLAVNSSLAANKTISITNEIDINVPSANLGFSQFQFNPTDKIYSIQNRCVGPVSVSILGNSGIISSGSTLTVGLSSVSGSSVFYSSSNCTGGSEISSVNINSGSSVSSTFYVKNPNAIDDTIVSSNFLISSGSLDILFNPEINLTMPSPNSLVENEEWTLSSVGGYGQYVYTFIDGSITSSESNIVPVLDVDLNEIGKKLVVLTQSAPANKIVRVTDSRGFFKDFSFGLFPVVGAGSITIQSSSPTLIPFNTYGNLNSPSFIVQNFNGAYVDGSLYGSSVDSSGYFSAGSGSSGIEYLLIRVPKATGGFSEARATITVNLGWPFGVLGDLVINSGQTVNLNAGQPYDYKSITINSGGTLNITGVGILVLGSVNDVVINGTITSSVITSNTCFPNPYPFSVANPDINIPTPITTSITQNMGGSGGAGGGIGVSINGGSGGSGNCGYGGGGGGGGSSENGLPGGSGGGAGGSRQFNPIMINDEIFNVPYSNGGAGMSTYGAGADASFGSLVTKYGPSSFSNVGGAGGGSGGGGPSVWGQGGGGGGMRGYHKNSLYIKTKSSIIGNGTVNLAGTSGFNGGKGGEPLFCSGSPGGAGGGGGGGAGGSGGNVFFYYKNSRSTLINLNLQGGSGGLGQSGSSKCSATFGSRSNSGSGGSGSAGNSGVFSYSIW